MLEPYLEEIYARGIILASASPARQQILRQMGLQFTVQVSGFAENADWRDFENPQEYALFNAKNKADRINSTGIVISADCVADIDGAVFEKPADKEDARRIMRLLSGRTSYMHTAVVVKGKSTFSKVVTTEIEFDTLSNEVIDYYVESGEWEGKAGGYEIQGIRCSTFLKRFKGCFYNVMGLPINELCHLLIQEIESSRAST